MKIVTLILLSPLRQIKKAKLNVICVEETRPAMESAIVKAGEGVSLWKDYL